MLNLFVSMTMIGVLIIGFTTHYRRAMPRHAYKWFVYGGLVLILLDHFRPSFTIGFGG